MKKVATFVASALLAAGLAFGANAAILIGPTAWSPIDGNNIAKGAYDKIIAGNGPEVAACNGCLGLRGAPNGAAGFVGNTANADAYAMPQNSALGTLVAFFNTITGGNTSAGTLDPGAFVKTNVPDGNNGESFTFFLQAGVNILKADGLVAYLLSPTVQSVTWTGAPGLSNYSQVPVPASILLLIGGLGWLGFAARRRKVGLA